MKTKLVLLLMATLLPVAAHAAEYDAIIRNGMVYDGTGAPGYRADVGIVGDRISVVGDLSRDTAKLDINAAGLAVAPGFINMLSHATTSLIIDPRGMSDILQGVTLEVFGEASRGPMNEQMKISAKAMQGDYQYDIEWTTLGEYLEFLERRGVSPNIASFVGASTVRVHEVGYADRAPTPQELNRMKVLVGEAMQEGALGLTTALIYAPATYADTEELIELAKVASEYGGMYIVHMRSEANRFIEAIDETMRIGREANLPVEIYHLKAAGRDNWPKMDEAIAKIEAAQNDGFPITANMYTYVAGATGLDASMPPWVQEGGYIDWANRLQDPEIRARVKEEMRINAQDWENLYYAAGPDKMILVAFKNPDLKHLTGRTLAEVARERGQDPEDTAMDLVVEDGSRVGTVYFLMSEENVKKQIALPWVSFGSDGPAPAVEPRFMKSSQHPRAYGNFARLLGRYVREEQVITLEEAIRKLTLLPATNLKIRGRGRLAPGFYADLAIFDPETISDHATFEEPHQYSTGMVHVFVNGEQVVANGEHTGATPGRVVRGPGWKGWDEPVQYDSLESSPRL